MIETPISSTPSIYLFTTLRCRRIERKLSHFEIISQIIKPSLQYVILWFCLYIGYSSGWVWPTYSAESGIHCDNNFKNY